MDISIRVLSIVTMVLWLIILFFSVTSVYSVMNVGVDLGEVQMLPSSRGISFSLPFSIENNGFYGITDLNVTTRVTDLNGTLLDLTKTIVPSIPQGTIVNSSHNINIDLDVITSMEYVTLLFEDSEFNVELFVGLNFAGAVPVQISTNTSIPWGAPMADFSIGKISVSPHNSTHREASVPINFENHAVLDLNGKLRLEFYAESQRLVASGETLIQVPSQQSFADRIIVYPRQQDAAIMTDGEAHFVFETTMFTVEWWENYD